MKVSAAIVPVCINHSSCGLYCENCRFKLPKFLEDKYAKCLMYDHVLDVVTVFGKSHDGRCDDCIYDFNGIVKKEK